MQGENDLALKGPRFVIRKNLIAGTPPIKMMTTVDQRVGSALTGENTPYRIHPRV